MSIDTSAGQSRSLPRVGAMRLLLAWFFPYVKVHRALLARTIVAGVVALGCQAVIPLIVDGLLEHAAWETSLVITLVGLVVLQVVAGFDSHRSAHMSSILGATALRDALFRKLLVSDVVRQSGMARTSIVSRHTSDVDNVAEGYEKTLSEGIPGVLRVVISLTLLIVIEWHAGVTMVIACLLFLVLRSYVGRQLLVLDRERLSRYNRVGERADESISGYRINSGLNMGPWQFTRFKFQVTALEQVTHRQGIRVIQLITAAHAAGLAGLAFVVLFAITAGGESAHTVAAAILYVEGVVRGLETLPPWIRSVQLGVVSQIRIDHILKGKNRIQLPLDHPEADRSAGFSLVELSASVGPTLRLTSASVDLPRHVIIGVVTPTGTDPDSLLSLLAGDDNPESGSVLIDGVDARIHENSSSIYFVPSESVVFNASVLDHLRSANPDLSETTGRQILESVSLGHLAELPGGLDEPLGPMGARLSVCERQRLLLSVALAANPRVLMVGSLRTLADPETALPLITRMRAQNCAYTLVNVNDPEVAEFADTILFVSNSGTHLGTHQELLSTLPDYARLWEQRLNISGVDLTVLGISESDQANLQTRLVTERYAPGDFIYRQGTPADRIIFTISGQIEISTTDADGNAHRVAVLGPGNHCGDPRLAVGEKRSESAVAIDNSVVRSLSREAISAGMMGLLDRTPTERRIVSSILKAGPSTAAEVEERLSDVPAALVASSIAMLHRDGALRETDGRLSVVQKRSVKAGARALLDRLGDL